MRHIQLFAAGLALACLTGCGPKGPCDIYEKYGTECVAAHSTTRKLYSKYDGPLYQIVRESDGKTLDIGTVDGGYADAAAQDAFLAGTIGYITVIYDQTGHGNDLTQAAPGTFKGPSKGEFNTLPIADMAPVMLDGHKVYGAYFMPGMGLRNNNASYLAINDEPEGIYYVVDGTHFDNGCCFDYGNSSTNGTAVGRGTMETTYFGTSTNWGSGNGDGPWIMADMESGLFSGFDAKKNDVPSITDWRFVTAYVNGGGGNHWDLRGGDATKSEVVTYYDGVRPESPSKEDGYSPMSKKGGLLLANGGDNGNGSAGTFYEGAMTVGYPSLEAVQAVQANIAAAKYQEPAINMSRLTTFRKGQPQELTVVYRNTTGAAVSNLDLSLELPEGWTSQLKGECSAATLAPGAALTAKFSIAGPAANAAGFARAVAVWDGGQFASAQRIRSAQAVSINEIAVSGEQFIELYNAGTEAVDMSGWKLEITRSGWAPVTAAILPAGTVIGANEFYVFRPNSDAAAFNAAPLSRIFIPVSTDPKHVVKAGSTVIPMAQVTGFEPGQKIGIDLGGQYEEVTVVKVGTPGVQTKLATEAKAGDATVNIVATTNLSEGMEITISTGQRMEVRKIAKIVREAQAPQRGGFGGPQQGGAREPGVIELDSPLTVDQISGVDVWAFGTGIEFTPALKFDHMSGDAVSGPAPKTATDGSYSYTYSTSAGAIALYDGDVLIDAVVYGSKQSNSSANGTITRPDLAVLEGEQTQGGCIVEVPQVRRGGFGGGFGGFGGGGFGGGFGGPGAGQGGFGGPGAGPRGAGAARAAAPAPVQAAPSYSMARFPDGNDPDILTTIQSAKVQTPGAPNTLE